MAENKQLSLKHHALILEGSPRATKERALAYLHYELCPQHGCGHCITCMAIKTQQEHNILWLSQDKYSVEDIDEIIEKTRFSLEDHAAFFCIIEYADRLHEHASNKLLKLIEEPVRGYHFLLLTQNAQRLLATIRSRCIIEICSSSYPQEQHQLVQWFTHETVTAPTLLAYLAKQDITEDETQACIEEIAAYWLNLSQQNDNKYAYARWHVAYKALSSLPKTGGSKIFWKNFYIQFTML